MVNTQFLVVSYFVSLFIDWILQWQWQAVYKSKWDKDDDKSKSRIALITHSIIYGFLTSAITCFLIQDKSHYLMICVILTITHGIIDTRIPVKYIMRFKGMSWDQIKDYNTYGFMHIGIDHRLHELVLLILSLFI
jgi:hypothetical protein